MKIEEFNPDGVGVDNGSYFGMPFTTDNAELVLISAPWDVTVSYGSGTALAPDGIIEASTQLDYYDEMALDQWHRGIATADVDYDILDKSNKLRSDAEKVISHLENGGNPTDDYVLRKLKRVNEGCHSMNENIESQASQWLAEDKIVGLVGGDHSTPYGLIKALGGKYDSFGILHIDAHCDLRQAYEGFEFSHASIMYNVLRDVPQVSKLTQVAVRDFCSSEVKLAQESDRVAQFSDTTLLNEEFDGVTWRQTCNNIVETLPQRVYISFDIDGLTIENCPHTGTPVMGGVSFNKAIYLINAIAESGRRIIGFDMVEVVPTLEDKIDAITGARILWKLCGITLKSNDKKL